MILSTILPGVRQLRAPLAAGYLWLLFVYLVAHLGSHQPQSSPGEDIVRLGEALTPAGLAVAVSFLAYLVGAFSKSLFDGFGGAFTERVGWSDRARLSQRGLDGMEDLLASGVATGMLKSARDAGELESDILHELDLIKTRLLDSKRDLYEEIDRLHAEADLRFALLPPLLAVGVVLVSEVPVGWAHAFATAGGARAMLIVGVCLLMEVFLFQAVSTNRRANDKIIDALLLEQVSAPAVDRWAREARDASQEAREMPASRA